MAQDHVLAIDQGTTGSTALIIDHDVNVVASVNVEFPNHYPKPGHVEHDPEEIWSSIRAAVKGAFEQSGLDPSRLAAVGVTNQRETVVLWDRKTGEPIHRALVWQDRRTAGLCKQLKEDGHEAMVRRKTGLVLDPYFSGTKVRWMLENVTGARKRANAGELQLGTIDTYAVWRLTGGTDGGAHVTDPSNASRTLLMDLKTLDWDDELTSLLKVPKSILPRIGNSSEVFGTTKGLDFLPDGIPVAGIIGDQQGALFGQACFEPGMAKSTYGTGAFILLNTGDTPTPSNTGMLTTVGWRLKDGQEVAYALEGSAFIAGAAVQWLRDGLGLISGSPEIEALARSVPDSGGVTFVPALAGLGAPHWRPDARGIITGITGGTTKAHLARATLDGIALQIDEILRAMAGDLGEPLKELRVDGGAAKNDLLMQRQADLLGVPCVRPAVLETTGLGSGLLAGLAVGFWESKDDVTRAWSESKRFTPEADETELAETRARWAEAVKRA